MNVSGFCLQRNTMQLHSGRETSTELFLVVFPTLFGSHSFSMKRVDERNRDVVWIQHCATSHNLRLNGGHLRNWVEQIGSSKTGHNDLSLSLLFVSFLDAPSRISSGTPAERHNATARARVGMWMIAGEQIEHCDLSFFFIEGQNSHWPRNWFSSSHQKHDDSAAGEENP